MRYFFGLLLFLLASTVSGATLLGQVIDGETFEPVPKAIVSINTVPEQTRLVDENGYAFTVTANGTYLLQAFVLDQNKITKTTRETITIVDQGEYYLDLVVFTDLDLNSDLRDILQDDAISSLTPLDEDSPPSPPSLLTGLIGLLMIAILATAVWHYRFRKKPSEPLPTPTKAKETTPLESNHHGLIAISDDKKNQTVDLLRKRGGRMMQRELRHELNFGEAYASLLIAELESENKIKKLKHGRGNIIILKE